MLCASLMQRTGPRRVIATACAAGGVGVGGFLLAGSPLWLALPIAVFGLAIGTATTASYTAASSIIPSGARGTGFGLLTTASLAGLAVSPIVCGVLGATSIRAVFLLDAVMLGALAIMVSRLMITSPVPVAYAPPTEEV